MAGFLISSLMLSMVDAIQTLLSLKFIIVNHHDI
jgi:hypothetical protein